MRSCKSALVGRLFKFVCVNILLRETHAPTPTLCYHLCAGLLSNALLMPGQGPEHMEAEKMWKQLATEWKLKACALICRELSYPLFQTIAYVRELHSRQRTKATEKANLLLASAGDDLPTTKRGVERKHAKSLVVKLAKTKRQIGEVIITIIITIIIILIIIISIIGIVFVIIIVIRELYSISVYFIDFPCTLFSITCTLFHSCALCFQFRALYSVHLYLFSLVPYL
jgi:hypothetical protein